MMTTFNDQYVQMKLFREAVLRFNESMHSSTLMLVAAHDRIDGLWRDDFRKEYDAQWGALRETLYDYFQFKAPRYEEFVDLKLQYLERYLNANGRY